MRNTKEQLLLLGAIVIFVIVAVALVLYNLNKAQDIPPDEQNSFSEEQSLDNPE